MAWRWVAPVWQRESWRSQAAHGAGWRPYTCRHPGLATTGRGGLPQWIPRLAASTEPRRSVARPLVQHAAARHQSCRSPQRDTAPTKAGAAASCEPAAARVGLDCSQTYGRLAPVQPGMAAGHGNAEQSAWRAVRHGTALTAACSRLGRTQPYWKPHGAWGSTQCCGRSVVTVYNRPPHAVGAPAK